MLVSHRKKWKTLVLGLLFVLLNGLALLAFFPANSQARAYA